MLCSVQCHLSWFACYKKNNHMIDSMNRYLRSKYIILLEIKRIKAQTRLNQLVSTKLYRPLFLLHLLLDTKNLEQSDLCCYATQLHVHVKIYDVNDDRNHTHVTIIASFILQSLSLSHILCIIYAMILLYIHSSSYITL
jgi:hypothetical protein